MTCKDCYGCEICAEFGSEHLPSDLDSRYFEYKDIDNVEQECSCFKEKSRIVESPCNAGDMVYVLEYEDDCAVDYSGYIFIMANNDFAFLSPVINGERNPIEICNVFFDRYINFEDNSGIIVPLNELYLTKEKAETKLKELNNER